MYRLKKWFMVAAFFFSWSSLAYTETVTKHRIAQDAGIGAAVGAGVGVGIDLLILLFSNTIFKPIGGEAGVAAYVTPPLVFAVIGAAIGAGIGAADQEDVVVIGPMLMPEHGIAGLSVGGKW